MSTIIDYKSLLLGFDGVIDGNVMEDIIINEYCKTGSINPCIDLVESIINNNEDFSKNFVEIFLITMLDRRFISFKNIITLIKLYNLLECYDEYFTIITTEIIDAILGMIEDNLTPDAKDYCNNNYQLIPESEFDEIMFILANVLEIDNDFYTGRFSSYFKIFETWLFSLNELLPSRWFSDSYLFGVIGHLFDNQKMSLSITGFNNRNKYNQMRTTVYIMYFNPEFISEKIKKKLWIEQHACDFLIEKKNNRIKYYSKVFGGGYRQINNNYRGNLPHCLVEYILEFVGLDGMDTFLRNGKF